MPSYLRYLLIVVALLAAGFVVACGGDSDDNGEPDSDEPTAEQPADGDDAVGDGVSGALGDLAEQFGISEVKIEYDFATSGAGDDFEGTMTLYWKPPDAWRMDIGTADSDVAIIFNADVTYLCTSDGDEGVCLESPLTDALGIVPFFSIFTDPSGFDDLIGASFGSADVSTSSREIAGEDATCFEVSGDVDGEEGAGEFCFRDDGVLLLMRASGSGFESDGEFSLVATNVSDSVSDEDLQPLYDVQTIPGLGDFDLEDFDLDDIPGLDDIDLDDLPDAP